MPNYIKKLLEEGCKKHPNKTALSFENKNFVTFKALDEKTDQIANGLAALGVKQGDRVAVLMPNSLEITFSWLAINKLGAIEVPINLANKGDFLKYVLNNSQSSVLIIDGNLMERISFIESELKYLKNVVIWNKDDRVHSTQTKFKIYRFEEFDLLPKNCKCSAIKERDTLAIIYTSGTTGPSKGVMYTVGQAAMAANEYLHAMKCNSNDALYTCLPLFHGNAQFLCVLPGIIAGLKVTIYKRFSASKFWKQINDTNSTVFNLLGAMAVFLYNQKPSPKDHKNISRVCMAAPMPKEIYRQFEKRFQIKVIEGYGLTETGMITYNEWEKTVPGSCGKQTNNYEVKIVDEEDNCVEPNTVGEIVARSKVPWTMCSGYYNDPAKTVEVFRNFFFHTGDAGYLDEQGNLYFKDRVKDYIRRRGENISSNEVENVFLENSQILECAAVGIRSEHSEDEVMIVIVKKDGVNFECKDLIDWCVPRMPYFAVPRYIRFIDQLPKTQNEKVKKDLLRKQGITNDTWDREKSGYHLEKS